MSAQPFSESEEVALSRAVATYLSRAEWDGDCLVRQEIRGYGDIQFAHHRTSASRAVYMNAFGPLPSDLHVRHRCDRPGCVNIDHLEPGTPSQNNRDKRRTLDRRNGTPGLGGEAHRSAVLNADLVAKLRRRAKSGEPLTVLTEELGGIVSFNAVRRAVRGLTWKLVEEAPAPPHHRWAVPSPTRWPLEDKVTARRLADEGVTLAEIARQLGCSRDTAFLLTQDEVA